MTEREEIIEEAKAAILEESKKGMPSNYMRLKTIIGILDEVKNRK